MRIVVDAMGGDHAPSEIVKGAVVAAKEFGDEIILVGREADVRAALGGSPPAAIRVVHASEVIEMDDQPATAVRAKKDSSMSVGIRLVKDGEADAFVTMGNTGGALAAALFGLGRIQGIKRPALATVFPTLHGFTFMLDIGANTDVRPEWLVQFALMGSIYVERVLGVAKPRVGLISNGEEESKGNELVQATYPLLKAAPINFIGNIEGKDMLIAQVADVVVTDGFTGNVIIKFAEAIGKMMREIIKEEVTRDPFSMLGGAIAKGAFSRVSARADDSPYGGAVLLGVDGIVVIGHGRAKADAVVAAVRAARRAVAQNVVATIAEGVKALPQPEAPPA
ncbi:MAG: phosphate acyltransferase PlsX [Anaerolineae bacterium]